MSAARKRSPEIIALGEPLVEFAATEPGPLSEVASFKAGCGGDTSNFAVAVNRLGGSAGYISRIGTDPLAAILVDCWASEGVDTSWVARDDDALTGLYFTSREDRRHHFTYYRRDSAASRMQPQDLPVDYLRRARWLHVSGISQAISPSAAESVDRAVDVARQAGLMVSFDPNLRMKLWSLEEARETIHRLAARVDVLLPSHEDAHVLTGEARPEAIVAGYLNMGPRVVILKMGAEGALFGEVSPGPRRAVKLERVAGFTVETIDASGAGDTFDAAYAVACLEGRSTRECVRFANAAGALVTTGIGTLTPIPSRADVAALMEKCSDDASSPIE